MKILGVGVDLVINKRIQHLIKNKNFLKRTFGSNELKFSKKKINKTNYFAKRFAAKEALSKSIGTGIRDGLYFKNIEILNDKMGKPYFYKSRKLDQFVKKKFKVKKYDLFLSLSDEKDHSIAFTILIERS
tara:strand:- start:3934 stop:4323 length:390 start_codon:yes stop_codon:yes gene_type:complete